MTERYHRLPSNPLLGRNVHHDEASKNFPAEKETVKNVHHKRHTPILNQLNLGKCTAEAATGLLGCDQFFKHLPEEIQKVLKTSGNDAGEADAYSTELYHEETELQDPNDAYPPHDPGGSGLMVMKAVRAQGYITSYHWAFGLEHAVRALALRPVIIGISWYNSMFELDKNGFLNVDESSGLAGGHEVLLRAIDFKDFDNLESSKNVVIGDNSWGKDWGIDEGLGGGSFRMHAKDLKHLLADAGDCTAAVPLRT